MASLFHHLQFLKLKQKRSFCTTSKWKVKQVTTSNFTQSLDELKTHISSSDFIAISMEKTGSSCPRVLPFDTAETAYLKLRPSAHRFQLLHFAVCPFSVTDSNNLVAHPYNFLLFPRDELKMGMPAYSFSCQTSYLASMARKGFDFNACIYNGISYLSRAQESLAKIRIGTASPSHNVMKSSSPPTVADKIFVERIRSRIRHWRKTCKSSGTNSSKDELINSLRSIVLGSEQFRSRPSLTIDVCSERQAQLILEMLVDFADDLLPLPVPAKSGSGTTQAVRIVLANSKEDKDLLEKELQSFEEEENKKIRGFREVIDLISASQKPVISHNSLNDCTLVHSKFIAPLPPQVDEFISSLCTAFPKVLDLNYLMKKIGSTRKLSGIPSAISYLNNNFYAPVDLEIPDRDTVNKGRIHGLNALRLCYLFMKLCSILKISPIVTEYGKKHLAPELENATNVFHPCSTSIQESCNGDINVWTHNTRKVSCENVVFLWGFKFGTTAGMLKNVLRSSHDIFSGEFDVKLVDKSCAIVVFWQQGLSKDFLDVMNSEEISGDLKELVSDGVRVTCYDTYKTMCRLGLWEMDLAESLERALESSRYDTKINGERHSSEIHWYNDNVINFDDL
ncbi:poly(A)-specific ribonuclease PARN-like isoform X2 [Lotus japonicus]|uniref:poly(A)-specific ribonuclease PARN-like isoform X2 n=1 Tax=Lotus japonicus TaxID=34305 RepID=UPI0025825A37|nr:poly(A)-specific ribonuclease PARN-like isoform X2 [Lotus japonicus]